MGEIESAAEGEEKEQDDESGTHFKEKQHMAMTLSRERGKHIQRTERRPCGWSPVSRKRWKELRPKQVFRSTPEVQLDKSPEAEDGEKPKQLISEVTL